MAAQGVEQTGDRRGQAPLERMRLHAQAGPAQPPDAGDARRRGGMPPVGFGGHGQLHHAFFAGSDHGAGLAHPREYMFDDGAALIDHQGRADVPGRKPSDHVGRVLAHDFLVAAESQIDVLLRDKPPAKQCLGRLQDTVHGWLGVERAAAPKAPIGNHAGEGRLCPVRFLNRNDIVMGHQDDRPILASAPPAVEQAAPADLFET